MSRALRDQGAAIPHLSKGEIKDLREDVDAAFTVLEGAPKINKVTGGTAVSLAAVPVAKALAGSGFLQGKAKATLSVGTGTSELGFTANRPGTPGNGISVEVVDSESGGLAVSVTDLAIEIDLGGATPDADTVKTALDGDTDIHRLVAVTSGGAGLVAVTAAANLSGGTGEGFKVYANGLEQAIEGEVTDAAVPMVVSDLTGAANGDMVGLYVESDGLESDQLSLGVVT